MDARSRHIWYDPPRPITAPAFVGGEKSAAEGAQPGGLPSRRVRAVPDSHYGVPGHEVGGGRGRRRHEGDVCRLRVPVGLVGSDRPVLHSRVQPKHRSSQTVGSAIRSDLPLRANIWSIPDVVHLGIVRTAGDGGGEDSSFADDDMDARRDLFTVPGALRLVGMREMLVPLLLACDK